MDKPPNRRAERNDFMTVVFPVLISEIAKRGIKRKDIAGCLGICEKTLKQKRKPLNILQKIPFPRTVFKVL